MCKVIHILDIYNNNNTNSALKFGLPTNISSCTCREEADSLERELHSIERSIVIPICLNREAREFFPDRGRGTPQLLDRYLAAAKRLQRLDTSGDIDQRKKSLLKTVMSCLADEFCHLKVWKLDDAAMRDHSPASIWDAAASARRSRGGRSQDDSRMSYSSSGSFTASGGTSDASYGAYCRGLGEEPSVHSHNTFAAGMIYVDRSTLGRCRSSVILRAPCLGANMKMFYEQLLIDTALNSRGNLLQFDAL